MQQMQRGGKRSSKPHYNSHNSSFNASRPGPPRVHARSHTLPQNHFEVDSLSSSSYPDINKPRHGPSYYKGPPAFRSAGNNHYAKNSNSPQYNNAKPHTQQSHQSSNDYNYQRPVPQHVPHTLSGSGIRSDLSSPNKNSHLLHGTKEAIYDLLLQNPGGIVGENIEEAYFRIFRTKLPYYQLGHRDVKGFIESIPDIVRIDYSNAQTPICHLAHRQEKQTSKKDYKNSDWSTVFPESFHPLEQMEPDRGPSPDTKFNLAKDAGLNLEEDYSSFVLTEEEKKRHINDLKSKIYIFLMSKGGPVPLEEFEHQYRAVNREDPEIAYRVLGYATLKEFLREIKDILQFIIEDKDGSTSVTMKTKKPSPPSPGDPLRSYVNNARPFMPPSNLVRPFPAQIHPVYRTTLPNSGFIPAGAPLNIRPQRRPNDSNQNVPRFPTHTHNPYPRPPRPPIPEKQSYLTIPNEPQIPFQFRADPPGFEANINPSIIPLSPLSDPLLGPFPLDGLMTNLSSLSLRPETTPLKPFNPSHTTIHSLNMDFSKAQRDFVQTQIVSIAEMRSEVKMKFSCEPVLRFLEGNNVVLLAGEDQGKCALTSVALTNGLNVLTDNLQSLVICQDAKGAHKIFQCLENLSDNTGLKVSCYDSPEKFKSVRTEAHIIVLIHSLLGELFTQYNTTQLTRIGLYNLITDLNTYYEIVRILKLHMSGKLNELKFFFATNPHNEAGTFILKLINTLMVSKCIFSYYGKDQETCLTLLPHDVESNQIRNESDADIRPHLLASLTRTRTFPNLFDKFLIPLGASCNNFTILSNHMEEELLLQSLALIAMNKVEPSTATTQVAIVVPNEQQAKDFLELCELGQVAGVKSLMVNGKTIKEEMRYTHICIGW